jgi:hypothetical protein
MVGYKRLSPYTRNVISNFPVSKQKEFKNEEIDRDRVCDGDGRDVAYRLL